MIGASFANLVAALRCRESAHLHTRQFYPPSHRNRSIACGERTRLGGKIVMIVGPGTVRRRSGLRRAGR